MLTIRTADIADIAEVVRQPAGVATVLAGTGAVVVQTSDLAAIAQAPDAREQLAELVAALEKAEVDSLLD